MPDTTGLSALDAVKAWASAYVAADGALAMANGRTADTIRIFQRCEEIINNSRPK